MLALEKQYEFYLNNEADLLKKYGGSYLVISSDCSVNPFSTKQEAYLYGADKYGLGNFLLQFCDFNSAHTVNTINVRMTDA